MLRGQPSRRPLLRLLRYEIRLREPQLWVQDGDDPVPCRWAFTLLDEPSEPLFVSSFDSWVSNPSIDAARFRFVAPAGAKKMELKAVLAGEKPQ